MQWLGHAKATLSLSPEAKTKLSNFGTLLSSLLLKVSPPLPVVSVQNIESKHKPYEFCFKEVWKKSRLPALLGQRKPMTR